MIDIDALSRDQLLILHVLGKHGGVVAGGLYNALGEHLDALSSDEMRFVEELCEWSGSRAWSDGQDVLALSSSGYAVYEAAKPTIAHLEQLAEMAEIIAANTYRLWCAILSPNPASRTSWERMDNPQVGDLVLEITSMIAHRPALDRLGRLLDITPDGRYKIRLMTGEEITWDNAKMIVVFEEAIGHEPRRRGVDYCS